MSEEALQIAEKRKDVKGKGEKERYTQLNAELERIAGKIYPTECRVTKNSKER